jgi:hypothetical protein
MKLTLALLFVCLASDGAIAAADPVLPPATVAPARCVYSLLKADPAVRSVDVYVVDNVRAAIELVFRDKAGSAVVSDIVLTAVGGDVSYMGSFQYGESEGVADEEIEFLSRFAQTFTSQCHLSAAFDDLLPSPEARSEWRHVDPPETAP